MITTANAYLLSLAAKYQPDPVDMCGENLTRPEPYNENKFGESRAVLDHRLPFYTAGFE